MNTRALLAIHDPAIVESLSRSLNRPDLVMSFSTTVGDTLEKLSRNHVAMVFCEARLPDGSFREVIRFLQAAGRKTPLVVCANFYDRATEVEAAMRGAQAYLTYPFLPQQVQRLASEALGNPSPGPIVPRAKEAA